MTIRDAVAKLQAHAFASGAVEAPTDPTEGNIGFPFSVSYLGTGNIIAESGGAERDLVTIFVDLHVNRVDLPTDIQTALNFYETFKGKLIADPTLGGTVSAVQMDDGHPIHFTFGQMEYAGIKTLGFRWEIMVKQRS